MAVQDLTPQLRTRLGNVERAVGLFVTLATLLLVAGFAYYLHHTAQRKGWFLKKFPFHTFVESATGMKVGDPIKLMGFDVGEITQVTAMPPFTDYGNVYIQFNVKEPFQGYIWDDSRVTITAGDFLGKRNLELIEGGLSGRTNLHEVYKIDNKEVTGLWNDKIGRYDEFKQGSKGFFLAKDEAPALTVRLEQMASLIEKSLPGILHMTNQLNATLSNVTVITAQANTLMLAAHPIITNAAVITANLKDPNGSLGAWILPPDLHAKLNDTILTANQTIARVDMTLASTDTNVTRLATSLDEILISLGGITSNLNAQVGMNTNLVSNVNNAIASADTLMQGLQRHWLLRSAFKKKPAAESSPAPKRPK